MYGFKPKKNKKFKINKHTNITLDGKHQEFMREFSNNESINVPSLKCEKKNLLNNLNNNDNLTIEEQLDIKDRINSINNTIADIHSKKKDYFLENSKYIFNYFEEKQNISTSSDNNNINHIKNDIVNSFFNIKEPKIDDKSNNNYDNNIQKYLNNVDDHFFDISSYVYQTDICNYCNRGEMTPLEDEGVLICNSCSISIPYLIENEKPSYKEPPKEICFYAYKRINHFKEILSQFQGKETTQIPPDVIINIKLQMKKERISLKDITNQKTKEILKNLGYNKYYEHIQFIKEKLGIKPQVMSAELEETLCNLFIELQAPYSKYCPDDRVNFLNYYYTAYKLCELLGKTQYLEHFPMLKDREKRIEQDTIWKKICAELDWEFIPTM
jgi:hypothetical protein